MENKIKTYPLQFTATEYDLIKAQATKQGKSIKDFFHDAIKKELNK